MSDVPGYAASSAVLASFLMRSMVPLRLVAIRCNPSELRLIEAPNTIAPKLIRPNRS
jgi:hypothetical protein